MTVMPAPPVFLDRDGTLIVEKHYLSDPDQVCIEDGVVEGLAMLIENGHPLFVLSNQSGIGRGMFAECDARRVNEKVAHVLLEQGIEITAWYFCPHTPASRCDCRKPSPGMAIAASRDWNLELAGSYVIGDKQADLELADAIDATGILVTTGHGRESADWARDRARPVFDDLRGAAGYILRVDGEAIGTP
ncbi:MAG TPA: HAD family hydrolase [Steroidobacteraceae bacterium]|jgi:histidinol-phosphate phosphatase family protein|nr:HAD family hydrolase [Steroidobacteraceae bacterium]